MGLVAEWWRSTLPGMRSKLFVPGTRPELFSKAMAGDADAISIDLEDAVLEARKAEARQLVGDWLRGQPQGASCKTVIVRINAMDTPHFEEDVCAMVQPGVHVLNLPKPHSVDAVRAACAAIARAEQRNGVSTPVRLLLNIETPRALRLAAELGAADGRVMGLQVGLGDLFEPAGVDRRDVAAVQQVLLSVRMAAAEAGVQAFDGAFANVQDAQGYADEAHLARRLGFAGKTCIHPSQVPIANAAFSHSAASVAWARELLAATQQATEEGRGAFLVNGRMVDAPFILRAQAIVRDAERQPPFIAR